RTTAMSIEALSISDGTPPDRLPTLLANRIKRGGFLYWAVLFTVSAAIIHFLALLLHRPQSGLLGAFLLLGALIQAISAVSVVLSACLRAGCPFLAASPRLPTSARSDAQGMACLSQRLACAAHYQPVELALCL